jgi:hypothetical protein
LLHGTARRGLRTGQHERAPIERGIGELLALRVGSGLGGQLAAAAGEAGVVDGDIQLAAP